MSRINVPPTRSNLQRLKRDLQFAKEGYEILNRKREVLTTELMTLSHDAQELQEALQKLIETAYSALEKSQLTMGRERVEWAALSAKKTTEVSIKFRGVMGVAVPRVTAQGQPPEMAYSPADTNASLDEASEAFRGVLAIIPDYATKVTSVWRLAHELRKTLRRVNALQYVFIPEYQETVLFIIASLEEREREETFRLKLLKTRSEHAAEDAAAEEEAAKIAEG
jgi:V/A-type H+/Na+-transporting ATPase subunit D